MAFVTGSFGLLYFMQRTLPNIKGYFFLLCCCLFMLDTSQARALRNLYDICPSRRHIRSPVTASQLGEICDKICLKVERLQDSYHSSGRIDHGQRRWLESVTFEQLPKLKQFQKEEDLIFQSYHGLVTFVYFLELSQNDEYDNFGEGPQSFFEEFQDIIKGHDDQVYNFETLLCELAVVIHDKGWWKSFQLEDQASEEVRSAASDLNNRQAQLERDYVFLEKAALYLKHIKNQAPTYLARS